MKDTPPPPKPNTYIRPCLIANACYRYGSGVEANPVYDNDAHDILDDLTGPTDATIEGVSIDSPFEQ
ncbi:hypothetical protein Tco_0306961 [Tanacetum coccineum]